MSRRDPSRRLPIVGVMGSGVERHEALAGPLGRGLARMGVHLLTGGGKGTMAAVSEAFAGVRSRTGLVLGVLPGDAHGRAPAGYPNPHVELVIATHLPHSGERGTELASRNHINVLSAQVVVALPGGAGTRSELALCARYARPAVALWPEALVGDDAGLPVGVSRCATVEQALAFVEEQLVAAGHPLPEGP